MKRLLLIIFLSACTSEVNQQDKQDTQQLKVFSETTIDRNIRMYLNKKDYEPVSTTLDSSITAFQKANRTIDLYLGLESKYKGRNSKLRKEWLSKADSALTVLTKIRNEGRTDSVHTKYYTHRYKIAGSQEVISVWADSQDNIKVVNGAAVQQR